ncbi:MAG: hypothetical protein Q9227_002549 [Pyrenula ochraceoflavens]
MADQLKREVKEKAHLRRGERPAHLNDDHVSVAAAMTSEPLVLPQRISRDLATSACDFIGTNHDIHDDGVRLCPNGFSNGLQRGADCTLAGKNAGQNFSFGRSETVLLMFYLERLFPFLFPFYRPSLLQGGRAWILEMMISSPVVRQATLCQSSYFFSLTQVAADREKLCETVFTQTRDAFEVLRQSLQVIDGADITEHLHGAIRIMASIMQMQRFEIAVSSFENCQAHLNAALALFRQLLDSTAALEAAGQSSSFEAIIRRLGPPTAILPAEYAQVPSAEQAAFRFSSALLIFDDIIASTVLQRRPKLYEYHHCHLGSTDGNSFSIDLQAVVGCQNWVLLQIGEIAVLDAWKQQCVEAENLSVVELVHRATPIRLALEAHLVRLEANPETISEEHSGMLDIFTADDRQQSGTSTQQSCLVTRVWAHAAFLYLCVVVSGWQPASVEVRHHVYRIVELLTEQMSPPALLRTMAWPFCVAGCLAEPTHEASLRRLVELLRPPSVFGTVRKAFEIIENVWRNRNARDLAGRDIATCFRNQGDFVLLI